MSEGAFNEGKRRRSRGHHLLRGVAVILSKRTCSVEELLKVLPSVLIWMTSVEPRRGPSIVIANDEVTGRFVQFYGGFGMPMVLEVPTGNEGANTPLRAAIEKQFGPPKQLLDGLELFRMSWPFQNTIDNIEHLEEVAELTQNVLTDVLELPKNAEVVVQEILAGMARFSKDAVS